MRARARWMRAAALSLFLPAVAAAHEKWLEVEPFVSAAPGPVKIYLLTGEALKAPEALPERRLARFSRFALLTGAAERDLRPALREDRQPIAGEVEVPEGTSLLVLDTAPVEIELAAERFNAYLFEERLYDMLMLRARKGTEDAPGRERYSRCMKAIVQAGTRRDRGVTRRVGQELEIVPAENPYALAPGGTLGVQVFFRGRPLAGRALLFANRYRGSVATKMLRTDERGQVSSPLSRTGLWLISLVHMVEESAARDIDFRSFWASLSFALPDP